MSSNHDCLDTKATIIIFGATGDLTRRKLMPALYNLIHEGLVCEDFSIVCVGRREKTTNEFRDDVYKALSEHSRNQIDDDNWNKIKKLISYIKFDLNDRQGYIKLKEALENIEKSKGVNANRIFYLAVAPENFGTIVENLALSGLAKGERGFKRLVIEKPFGKDLSTARALNKKLLEVFNENEIYRIDHYLGKDMIQNIMVLRFCNQIFNSLWSNKYIDNVQISLLEQNGVGTRGRYYENSGAMRDMVQNHIVQILSMVAMEPPGDLKTEFIRNEKLKVINSIESLSLENLKNNVVIGQYGRGDISNKDVIGYKEEDDVSKNSKTETFVALKLNINNFRWAGTPFYIRTGKRLGETSAQIVIEFKRLPDILYFKDTYVQEPNLLVIKIQPNVGVFFQFNTKDFKAKNDIVSMKMDTSYNSKGLGNTPEAYERLILDIIKNDSALFSRWDEVELSWRFADKIIDFMDGEDYDFPNYRAGSYGPIKAMELLEKDNRKWWNI